MKRLIPIIILLSPLFTLANNQSDYLYERGFTNTQVEQVLSYTDDVRDADHFIKWFGAICNHEMWWTFVDGQTNYLCGRLKRDMYMKPFDVQLQWWVETYNKFWWKNNTVDQWIHWSRYCTHEVDGRERCPNWKVNVKIFKAEYTGGTDNPVVAEPQDSNEPTEKPTIEAKNSVATDTNVVTKDDWFDHSCRRVANANPWQRVQIDTIWGRLLSIFRVIDEPVKVFVCQDT